MGCCIAEKGLQPDTPLISREFSGPKKKREGGKRDIAESNRELERARERERQRQGARERE